MFTSNSQPQADYVDTRKLGQWLNEHSISRAEIARNVQASLRHLMNAGYPSELESQIAIRMKNSILNDVVKRAVKKGLSVEEWILSAVEEKLEKEHQ